MTVPAQPLGYLDLLRTRTDFRRLWLGTLISLLGDWFNTIALYTLVAQLTGSPFALGAVFIFKMLPAALASPIAGLIVDQFDRRRLMIWSDLLRAVVVLGFLLIDEPQEVPLLYLLIVLQVVLGAVFQPAKSASVPNLVADRDLITANAISSATWSVMLAVGAALGGFAAEWLGLQMVFLLDSLTYVLSAWFIYRTRIPQDKLPPPENGWVRTAYREIKEGWQHMRSHPQIERMALSKATWALGGGSLVYTLTLLGEEIFPAMQAAGIGLLFSARGIGTGIGPIVARAVFRDQRHWPAVLGLCIACSGVFYGVVGWMPWTYLVLLFVVLAHATSGANWVLTTVLLQQRTADRFRGRVFATEWLFVMMADVISIFTASLFLEQGLLDLRGTIQVFALLQVICGVGWLVLVVPRERAATSFPRT
ncbi:MAG: MFS transporter [Bacteroidota bacterium]